MIPSLNLNIRGIGRSATLEINERSKRLAAEGRDIFRFGLGQSPFPVPEPVVQALRDHAHEKDYLAVEGLPELRAAVADMHHRLDGTVRDPDLVMVGPGSKELMFLLQLVYYGDLVVPTPCWVSYGPQARIIGRNVVKIPTRYEDRWRLTATALDAYCATDVGRPRVVILNYPGNPDGASYTADELQQLARVARKHKLVLLSDEIYGPLHHEGEHVSIARYYPEGTMVSGGLSKWCGAGGWRLGTCVFPRELEWLRRAMTAVASETYTSVSAPIQFAAVTAFRGGPWLDEYLTQCRRILKALGLFIARTLRGAGIRVHDPQGAFYFTLDFADLTQELAKRGIAESTTMCQRLLDDTGVAILPGAAFEREPAEMLARMAYVDFDGEAALQAAKAVELDRDLDLPFLETYCRRVVDGTRAMAAWFGS